MGTNQSTPAPERPLPDPDIHPSSPPDGPGTIPPPATPQPDPDTLRQSNPNAGSPDHGLGGGMGVSSERFPVDPQSIDGTGSRGTATRMPDGTWPTLKGGGDEPDQDAEPPNQGTPHPQDPAEGPEYDPRMAAATQEWREDQPAANVQPDPPPVPGATSGTNWQGIDRTVGEENPAGRDS
jgi:hypothetical protein